MTQPHKLAPLQPGAHEEQSLGNSETAGGPLAAGHAMDSEVDRAAGTRFHDMDSLRAAMMLLGIVFHAAWFFIPLYFGNTLSDVSGSWGFLYFFAWVHQFRMQVFFLIAGFFACLLIHKRGDWSFAKNRCLRVVIPFALAMLTLWPLMKLQYIRGGLLSGRILSEEPLMTQFWTAMAEVNWRTEWVVHLWFLHCLILLYAISWLLKMAFDLVIDRRRHIRPRLERATTSLTRSHLGPFVLAVPVAACMAYDLTWFGIDSGNLDPLWLGVLAYWIFFGVGWCLYSKPEIIDLFARRWPIYLAVGSLMSLLLCGYFHNILLSGRISWFYPVVLDTEMDYPSVREKLLSATEPNSPQSDYALVWKQLSPTYQQFVRDNSHPSSDQLSGFALELSTVTVLNPDFPALLSARLPTDSDRAISGPSSAALNPVTNRELLSRIFDGDVVTRWTPPLWIRGGYFYLYAVASWLMTFAMLGLFRQFMSHPSPTARYMADSSYWLYLIHLPLQFEISLYLAQWQVNGMFKFLLYNLLTFIILIPSYHYLVRSTWLGLLLNGRLYPIRSEASATSNA